MGLDCADYPEENMEFRVDWTPENDEYFIELVEAGTPFNEIADIFHALEDNLRDHYHYLARQGKAPPRVFQKIIPPEVMEYVIANLSKKSMNQMERETGWHRTALSTRLRKRGYKTVRKGLSRQVVWVKQ